MCIVRAHWVIDNADSSLNRPALFSLFMAVGQNERQAQHFAALLPSADGCEGSKDVERALFCCDDVGPLCESPPPPTKKQTRADVKH